MNGRFGYRARVRIMRDGVTYHEMETLDRKPAAMAGMKKRETELAKPRAIDNTKRMDPALAKAIATPENPSGRPVTPT